MVTVLRVYTLYLTPSKKGNGILVYKISKWWKLKNLNYIVGLKVGKVLLNTERKDIR